MDPTPNDIIGSAALCFFRSLGILRPEDNILPTRREDKPEQLHFLGFNPKGRLLLPVLCRVLVNTLLELHAQNLRLWSLGQKSHLQKGGVGHDSQSQEENGWAIP